MSPVKRTRHAVEEVLREIAEVYEFEIERMTVVENHLHIFLSAPPKYAPGEIVRIRKSRSAKVVFKEFTDVRKELWGGEFWSDGYFVRSVGDEVTAEVIRRYIEYHKQQAVSI